MTRFISYTTAAFLALNSTILYSAKPEEARKIADYATKNGKHEVYTTLGHTIDSRSVDFTIREDDKDTLSKLEIRASRALIDGREVLILTGNIHNPSTANYIRIQLDDGGLEKPLPLNGIVDTIEVAYSQDGKEFEQVAVPDDIEKNKQNIFDIYVGKLLRRINSKK